MSNFVVSRPKFTERLNYLIQRTLAYALVRAFPVVFNNDLIILIMLIYVVYAVFFCAYSCIFATYMVNRE